MDNSHQIRIIQEGTDLFAIDTIEWPEEVFKYPIVYTAIAVDAESYSATKIGKPGWRWIPIRRVQFYWLIDHHSCMVSYVDSPDNHRLYCYNHQCWEIEGKDGIITNKIKTEVYPSDPDLFEERAV